MNAEVLVVELQRGKDGKLYPAGRPWPHEVVARRRWLAHQLVCVRGLSFRQAKAAMLAEHGIRRSLGALCQDVRRFECPACASQPAEASGG